MNYYTLMDFKIEPFSNTPDPRLFFNSRQHLELLQKLEISIRLKRGLNVITGDIGTGKTTVSRQLIQTLSGDDTIQCCLMLDPGISGIREFLSQILILMTGETPEPGLDENQLKERIKNRLFSRNMDKGTTLLLIIDEGQKLSLENIEILRELLNFETNDEKLLQIAIFAQKEFETSLDHVENFKDRINFRYALGNLGFAESRRLVQYRLHRSFHEGKQRPVFTRPGFAALYAATKGSPRKIVNLCHQVIMALMIREKKRAGFFLVQSCAKASGFKPFPFKTAAVVLILTAALVAAAGLHRLDTPPRTAEQAMTAPGPAPPRVHTVPERPASPRKIRQPAIAPQLTDMNRKRPGEEPAAATDMPSLTDTPLNQGDSL